MLPFNQPLLINILGHAGGALIFAIFLFLLYSGRGWSGLRGRYLSGLAASLSLVWNAGSLVVLLRPNLPAVWMNLAVAISFSALSLLPAVLLHVSVGTARSPLVAAGYGLSVVAVGMHFWEIRGNGPALHQEALLLITVGFLLLTGLVVADIVFRGKGRGRPAGARIAGSMCLALFAMSFVHFGAGHASQAWSSELIVHHAGIPLALFVLLQDYRFVLLDAFVRFLANALLAALLAGLVIEASFRLVLVKSAVREPLPEALLLISICLFLVFFAWLRTRVQAWLTHAVFRQDRVASLPAQLRACPAFAAEERYLDWAASTIAAAVKTKDFAIVSQAGLDPGAALHAPVAGAVGGRDWAEAAVPIRLAQGNSRVVLLGRRQGGQRYMGEDLDSLAKAAAEIAGKPAALFVPTGTMGNTIAIKVLTEHGQEVICDSRAHVLDYELAMVAWFSGCLVRAIPTERGLLSAEEVVRPAPTVLPPGRWRSNRRTIWGAERCTPCAQCARFATPRTSVECASTWMEPVSSTPPPLWAFPCMKLLDRARPVWPPDLRLMLS